jgi:hypothetical protein
MTILLTALTPENANFDTGELLDGIYKNSVINGLSLVITAVVQTMQKQLDLYHAIFVMQIIFSLNFVYEYGMLCVHSTTVFGILTRRGGIVGQRRFIRSNRTDFRMKIFIGVQTFTTMVFTVWLLYVWIKDIDFGSQPSCNHLVKYVIFFADVRATATGLRVLFIIYLVASACMLLFRFGAIVSQHMEQLRKKIHAVRKEVWCGISRTEGQQESQESQESHELQESQRESQHTQQPQEQGKAPEVFRYVTLSFV